MTSIPPGTILGGARQKLTDWVLETFPQMRRIPLTAEELDLAVHIRGNEGLYNALTTLIHSRIQGRDHLLVPTDPLECKSYMERNHELRWLLSRLEYVYRSPINERAEETGEQPAA